jgi:hypothetical protein
MKKWMSVLMITLVLGLSACASIAGAATPVEPTATPGIVSTNYNNALPVASQLALGTIRLKDTPDALTAEEAKTMLVLWKGMQALATNSSASQLEVTALLAQIQDTMKPNQLQTIAAMKLTQADVQKVVQDLGTGAGGARAAASGSTRTNNNNQGGGFDFPGGMAPGGAAPGGGGAQGGNTRSQQNIPPSTQATIQARAAERSKSGNTVLYTAVIAYLQQVVAAK